MAHTKRPRNLNQRLPRSPSGQGFALLTSGERKLPAKLDDLRLRPLPSFRCPRHNHSRSNSASPPRTVSINRPCGVVVSAQVSASDLKPAPAFANSI